jgi:hypothetical protein
MTSKKTEPEADITLSVEDRTQALLDKQYGEGNPDPIPDAHMDLYDVPAAAPQAMLSNYAVQRDMSSEISQAVGEPLIPSLLEIFQGQENLIYKMQQDMGLLSNVDMSPEPKNVTIKYKNEPESLYMDRPQPRLLNLLVYFVMDHFKTDGKEVIEQLWKAKNNMNCELVSLIRQRFWDALQRRHFKKMPITTQDRTIKDNNPREVDNQRLHLLLGENVYQELFDLAEQVGLSNKTCFGECIRFALSDNLIEQEPHRPWTR